MWLTPVSLSYDSLSSLSLLSLLFFNSLSEHQCGVHITEYISDHFTELFLSIIGREKNSVWGYTTTDSSTSKTARDLLLLHALDALAGLCRGTNGRKRLLRKHQKYSFEGRSSSSNSNANRIEEEKAGKEEEEGPNGADETAAEEPAVEAADGSAENAATEATTPTTTFNLDVSSTEYDSHRLLVRGVISLVFGRPASSQGAVTTTPVTLAQQERAIQCLTSLCRDSHIESANQVRNNY